MSARAIIIAGLLGCGLAACGSDQKPLAPEVPDEWEFPSDETAFAIRLLTRASSVTVGEEFDVLVVTYNVADLFGASMELVYPSGQVEVRDVQVGSFLAGGAPLYIWRDERERGRVSFGATSRAGSDSGSSGSGVLFKVRYRALMSGQASFEIASRLELKTSEGNPIPGFSRIERRSIAVTVL